MAKALSQQLAELSVRAKSAEDAASTAQKAARDKAGVAGSGVRRCIGSD
jgi:hypothetical protein